MRSRTRVERQKSTSTRISDGTIRAVLFAAALSGLAACAVDLGGSAARDITVSRNAVTIAGPSGFCVDPRATRDAGAEAFVLLGNCAALSRADRRVQPPVRALLTAAVREYEGQPLSSQMSLLDDYLRSTDGRALLSRSGDPDTVSVLASFARGDVLFVRLSDTSPGYAPRMSAEHWRAVFDWRGTVVSTAVLGFDDRPLSESDGLATLEDFTRIIRSRNSAETAAPQG